MDMHERIKILREARNMTQVQLGKALGVTKQTVSNWENNNIQPSVDMLLKLSRYFAVSTDNLLGLDGRRYIEVTGLDEPQLTHIRLLIGDLQHSGEK